jgi:hypothetical protein
MVSEWTTIVLLPSSYCLHGSVFPDLPYSLNTLLKPSVHDICIVLYILNDSVKLASMINKDAEGTLKLWKEKIDSLQNEYNWRHVSVYKDVCESLSKHFLTNYQQI